jgi:hypothetical protein
MNFIFANKTQNELVSEPNNWLPSSSNTSKQFTYCVIRISADDICHKYELLYQATILEEIAPRDHCFKIYRYKLYLPNVS